MSAFTVILPHRRNAGNDAALRICLDCLFTNTVNDYKDLVEAGHQWRNREAELREAGDCLYQQMCIERTFRKCVESAV